MTQASPVWGCPTARNRDPRICGVGLSRAKIHVPRLSGVWLSRSRINDPILSVWGCPGQDPQPKPVWCGAVQGYDPRPKPFRFGVV